LITSYSNRSHKPDGQPNAYSVIRHVIPFHLLWLHTDKMLGGFNSEPQEKTPQRDPQSGPLSRKPLGR
jgi:hypothetical protein